MTALSAIRALQRQNVTLQRAATDPSIRGAPLAILVYFSNTLDPVEFRAVKVSALAVALHLRVVTAAQALCKLERQGYLQRGAKIQRVWSYRLLWPDLDIRVSSMDR